MAEEVCPEEGSQTGQEFQEEASGFFVYIVDDWLLLLRGSFSV